MEYSDDMHNKSRYITTGLKPETSSFKVEKKYISKTNI